MGDKNGDTDTANTATYYLLELFSTEIARDGGASLVTRLKDYCCCCCCRTNKKGIVSGKRLNRLLVQSHVGKAKVLTFLETYRDIFQVDRTVEPHWVKLIGTQHVDWSSLETDHDYPEHQHQQQQQNLVLSCQGKVQGKILSSLHHHLAKKSRRQLRNGRQIQIEDKGVNVAWLLRKCTWDFHDYLRASGIYLDRVYPTKRPSLLGGDVIFDNIVRIPGTKAWEDLVLDEFSLLLSHVVALHPDCLVMDAEQQRVWCVQEHINNDDNDASINYMQHLDDALTGLVHRDGANQIRLEVLLHRRPQLKRLLGGRDLWDLVQRQKQQQSNGYFERVTFSKDGSDILLQAKYDKTNSGGRMKVDAEGLFSVTNGKWGMAIARTMVNCCYQVGWAEKSKSTNNNQEHDITTSCPDNQYGDQDHGIPAIDLTASVGGMTLGLAKTRFFSRVIATEIDPHRANLCRQNMARHLHKEDHGMIDIRTMDAMDAILNLPRRSCILIDPPWGGENYKKKTHHNRRKISNSNTSTENNGAYGFTTFLRDEDDHGDDNCNSKHVISSSSRHNPQHLYMGDWTLDDVLCKIYHNLRPCLVGFRLPVTFIVNDFLERLAKRIVMEQGQVEIRNDDDDDDDLARQRLKCHVHTLAVRKMSVQLFVVLFLSADESDYCIGKHLEQQQHQQRGRSKQR